MKNTHMDTHRVFRPIKDYYNYNSSSTK
jgi:hypothetical protein